MKVKSIHFSVFFGHEIRHGGTKRSEQLVENFKELGIESFNPFLKTKQSVFFSIRKPLILFETIFFSIYLWFFIGVSLLGALNFIFKAVYPISLLKKYNPNIVFLETAPGFTLMFMHFLKFKNQNFVALPHNLEFMVPSQTFVGFRSLSHAFSCEIEGYRFARHVKVISDFDRTVLLCFNICSSVFPYFPSNRDQLIFNNIRMKREEVVSKSNYVVVGSVGNIPTFTGIQKLLNYKIKHKSLFKLLVAGYGTEKFKEYNSETINILGSLDEKDFIDLMINCKALLINQPQSSGFLTKIVEFNLCAIPVIILSDYMQAKFLEKYGVYEIPIDKIEEFKIENNILFFSKPNVNELIFSDSSESCT